MCKEVVSARGGGERLDNQIDRFDGGDVIAARQVAPEGRVADLLTGDRLVGYSNVADVGGLVGAGDAGVRGGGVAVVCSGEHVGEFSHRYGSVRIEIRSHDAKLDGPIGVREAGGPGSLRGNGTGNRKDDKGKGNDASDSLHFRRPPFLIFG